MTWMAGDDSEMMRIGYLEAPRNRTCFEPQLWPIPALFLSFSLPLQDRGGSPPEPIGQSLSVPPLSGLALGWLKRFHLPGLGVVPLGDLTGLPEGWVLLGELCICHSNSFLLVYF